MATHCSVLAWRIPRTGEPGGLPSMASHRVGHDWSDLAAAAAAAGIVAVMTVWLLVNFLLILGNLTVWGCEGEFLVAGNTHETLCKMLSVRHLEQFYSNTAEQGCSFLYEEMDIDTHADRVTGQPNSKSTSDWLPSQFSLSSCHCTIQFCILKNESATDSFLAWFGEHV